MARTIPADGHYSITNASVPESVMGNADSGALARVDISVENGLITSVTPAGSGPTLPNVVDMDGGIVLPAFVDLHTHLDKGHIWPRRPSPDGTWWGALLAVNDDRTANWAANDVERRFDFALRCAWAHGTAAIRTHLDSTPPQHEISFAVFEKMRERWAGRIELQAVSIVGPDVMVDIAQLREVARVVKAHRGVLGGSTAVHAENRKIMRNLIEVAGEFSLNIDIHADESPDPAASALQTLAEAVIETGYDGDVLAGHCCALAVQPDDHARYVVDKVVEAGVAVVSLPMCNMYLQDRHNENGTLRTPRWRGVTLLNELKAAGGRVAIASDNTRDPFYAYGDLDGFEVFREGARILHFDHPQAEAFAWARAVGADPAAIGGFTYAATIEAAAPADLVLFSARSWTELMSRPQADRTVLRKGTAIDTTLPDYRELDDLMGASA